MKKFTERIRKIIAGESGGLGFAATHKGRPPSLVLTVRVSTPARAAELATAGADAVLIGAGPALPEVANALQGIDLTGQTNLDLAALRDLAPDFAVVDDGVPATVLQWDETSLLLQVDASWDDTRLRVVANLPVEAVVYALPGDGPLTLARLMLAQRVAGLTQRLAFVTLDSGVGPDDARALRDANLTGVVLHDPEVATVRAWRTALDNLPARPKPRRNDLTPSLGLSARPAT
jgi:hypothetical protein